jgi:hypothetical protein
MSLTRIVNKLDNYDHQSLTESTFSGNNFKARGVSAVLVPSTFGSTILDTLGGLVVGIFAGLPIVFLREMGYVNLSAANLFKKSSDCIQQSNFIFAEPFKHLLRVINPKVIRDKAPFTVSSSEEDSKKNDPWVSKDGVGLLANQVHNAVKYLIKSESKLYRHTISRLVCALAPVAFVIARIADGIIGIAAAPFALLSGGCCESLNNIAYRGLQAPGLLFDLYRCAVGFIHPPVHV